MFALIKLIQSLFGALHSEGTEGQLACARCSADRSPPRSNRSTIAWTRWSTPRWVRCARVNEVQTQAQAQVAQQRARLDELQKQLEQRRRELTRIRLP